MDIDHLLGWPECYLLSKKISNNQIFFCLQRSKKKKSQILMFQPKRSMVFMIKCSNCSVRIWIWVYAWLSDTLLCWGKCRQQWSVWESLRESCDLSDEDSSAADKLWQLCPSLLGVFCNLQCRRNVLFQDLNICILAQVVAELVFCFCFCFFWLSLHGEDILLSLGWFTYGKTLPSNLLIPFSCDHSAKAAFWFLQPK